MKKSLLALAVLGSFATVASAQSSVTLWGIVDVSAKAVKNDGVDTLKSLATNGINSSRLGFRGTEDLGGGLKAGFWLEGSISPDTGAGKGGGGLQFDRRSTVSLMGGFGELRLGRDYTPTFWNTTIFDPFGTNGVGSSINLSHYVPQPNYVRASNSIGYLAPKMGGLYGQLMVAAGENTIGHYVGGRIGFASGPFNVAASVGKTDEFGATPEFQVWNIAGSWDFGMATVMAQYNNEEFGTAEENRALLGVSVPMGQGTLNASYVRTDEDGNAGRDASQLALGYVYSLSKRTAVYGTVARIDNKDNATFSIGGGNAGIDAGGNSTGFELGLRHSF
ncbi:MAG TPA: porin [Burkholderiaceae bacterium]|nr:porin [Burkholderiaceae bacterium]